MKENLSIDDIIKQAEEIREKTVKRAQSAIESTEVQAKEATSKTIEIPKPQPKKAENIEKTRVVSTPKPAVDQKTKAIRQEEKTGVVSDISQAKKSFFKNQSKEPVYSKRPPEIIERPATIKSKSRFDKTSDLEEIPTIVAVDELEKTIINSTKSPVIQKQENSGYDENDQIVLEGFEDLQQDRHVEKIDEDVAEQQLLERRKEKVNKFRLSNQEDSTESSSNSVLKGEFTKSDEKTALLEKLFASKSSVTVTVIITLVLGIPLALLTIFKDSAYMPSFLLDYTAYFITVTVLYGITILINIKTIFHGFNFKNGINSDFPIAFSNLLILAHTILLCVDSNVYIDGGNAFALAGAFSLLLSSLGKRALISRIIKNFEFLVSQNECHTVETITNTVDATIISRGLLTGEANLKTSIKTDFPTNFLEISSSDEPADKIAKITGSVMIALSIVLFGVFWFVNKNLNVGMNIGICSLAVSAPVSALLNTNSALYGVSRVLKKSGAMINGFEGTRVVDDANAIVIEAHDLFGPNSCQIHGIKTFNGAKTDDVILKTASVIMKTKSPLSYPFDEVVIGKQTILPDVDGVVYEDKLGTSAWIYRKKILVGTRELLIHHGVDVPRIEYEQRYAKKGRKILYLAVTGKLMAMFVVSYNADPTLKRALKKLEKSGMTVLVKSSDPYINDESIAQLFSLPDGFVRVMTASNGRAFEKYSNMCVEKSPAYVVHDGSALGFVSAMCAAENIEETRRILSVLVSFGSAVGIGVVTLLSIIDGIGQLDSVNVIVFQTLWCLFIEVVSKIKRLGM